MERGREREGAAGEGELPGIARQLGDAVRENTDGRTDRKRSSPLQFAHFQFLPSFLYELYCMYYVSMVGPQEDGTTLQAGVSDSFTV